MRYGIHIAFWKGQTLWKNNIIKPISVQISTNAQRHVDSENDVRTILENKKSSN